MELPKGWKLKKENGKQIVYESEKYQIIIWKKRGDYLVETFRKSPTYKARLFAQSFLKLREAKKFAVDIMGRDKIRKY